MKQIFMRSWERRVRHPSLQTDGASRRNLANHLHIRPGPVRRYNRVRAASPAALSLQAVALNGRDAGLLAATAVIEGILRARYLH